jgi:hypothetical protein
MHEADLIDKISRLVYWHKKRNATEKARSVAKSKLWLEKMPPPMIWKDIEDGLSETSKDACCW